MARSTQRVDVLEFVESLLQAFDERTLAVPQPGPRIVVLLVGLVLTLGVADLTLEVFRKALA